MKKIKQKLKKIMKNINYTFSKKVPFPYPVYEGNLLENRCALITGGNSGIGYSIAESFLKNKASVIIVGRNEEKLKKAALELEKNITCEGQFVKYFKFDIADVKNIHKNFSNILENVDKKIDILVNNAGVVSGQIIGKADIDEFENVIKTNLEGTFFLTQEVYNYMVKEKIKGNILNVTSSASLRPAASSYMLSKWALRGFTKGLAKKAIQDDIVVNAIAPGPTDTPMLKSEEDKDIRLKTSPSKRYALPEEIANLSTILVSDMSRMVVGDTLFVTGGASIITYDDMEY